MAKTKKTSAKHDAGHSTTVEHHHHHEPGLHATRSAVAWVIVSLGIIVLAGIASFFILSTDNALNNELDGRQFDNHEYFVQRVLHSIRGRLVQATQLANAPQPTPATRDSNLIGQRDVYDKIEDWSAYKRLSVSDAKLPFCYNNTSTQKADSDAFMKMMAAAPVYELNLPGLSLYYTKLTDPNLKSFAMALTSCVGDQNIPILHVYDDKVLWGSTSCLIAASKNTAESCQQTAKIVNDFFWNAN